VVGEDGKVTYKEVSAEEASSHMSKKLGRKVDYVELFNPDSKEVCRGALVEAHVAQVNSHRRIPIVLISSS